MTLLERLRAREEAAFAEAYARWGGEVYRFLQRLCGDSDLADDLFQETWMQLIRYAPRLRDDSNIAAWLCVVARNTFRKHRRFALLDGERLRELRWAMRSDEGESEAPLALDARLERALLRLPAGDRETILLSTSTDAPQEALAALLGISPASFRQRLSRARRRLQNEVSHDE
jgi:RNA polymerase sigma factor (sigma-70 family)